MQKKSAIYLGWHGNEISAKLCPIFESFFDLKFVRYFRFGEQEDQQRLAALGADFLFSFGPLVVKKKLLDSVGDAINFHPGPPKWPGRGSSSFALLSGDTEFAVTSHLMLEAIDAGPILRVIPFPITPDDYGESLHLKALEYIPSLVQQTIEDLCQNG